MLEIAQQVVTKETNEIDERLKMDIIRLYKEILDTDNLNSKDMNELL